MRKAEVIDRELMLRCAGWTIGSEKAWSKCCACARACAGDMAYASVWSVRLMGSKHVTWHFRALNVLGETVGDMSCIDKAQYIPEASLIVET